MGVSSDGLLWYGVDLGDGEDDLSEHLEAIINGPDEDADDYDEDADFYGDGREWLAEHGLTGVEFVQHCSYDYPMYGLAITGTSVRAPRGYPKQVDLKGAPDPAPILAAMRALEVPVNEDAIGWHLGSLYG